MKAPIVNPHAPQPTSPIAMIRSYWRHRQLIWQMSRREVMGRYRGSVMGIAWSFFNPVLMLIVYTFVFSVVFKAKWGADTGESKAQFAIILFTGMIVHGFFSEVANRAPSLVLENVNYVKKVIFPIEILPAVAVFSALFHSLISISVLLFAFLVINGYVYWTVIFIPIVLLPILILTIGISWILAALGVFLRDVSQTIGIITTVMMFLSPVFYPLSALPERFQEMLFINPLTFIIEQMRKVIVYGGKPDIVGECLYLTISISVAWFGFAMFQKARKGFSDVL